MDKFWVGIFGTVIWLAFVRIYFAARKKEWKFDVKSYKSWILAATTLLVFAVFFISCQCGTQKSIMRGDWQKIKATDLRNIDEAHKAKDK